MTRLPFIIAWLFISSLAGEVQAGMCHSPVGIRWNGIVTSVDVVDVVLAGDKLRRTISITTDGSRAFNAYSGGFFASAPGTFNNTQGWLLSGTPDADATAFFRTTLPDLLVEPVASPTQMAAGATAYPTNFPSGTFSFAQLTFSGLTGDFEIRGSDQEPTSLILLDGDLNGEIVGRISFTATPGDFDLNGVLDEVDIDLLAAADRNGVTAPIFDLNGDCNVTFDYSPSGINSDSDELIRNVLGTEYGDANLSTNVSLLDLDALGQNFGGTGGWGQGDFSGDGQVSLIDLDILGQKFGFVSPPSIAFEASGAASVPELRVGLLAWLAAFGYFPWRSVCRHRVHR